MFERQHVFSLAQRFIGIKEVSGEMDNPAILMMLKLDSGWPEHDEVPWCSAFANYICWLCRMPRSKNLRARSWLRIGHGVPSGQVQIGDIVVLKRGGGNQPGPDVIEAPGHVGFFAGFDNTTLDTMHGETLPPPNRILILGGNQADGVNVKSFPYDRLLGFRSLI